MSTDYSHEQDSSSQTPAPEGASSPLRMVLFVVLGVMIVALAYDYLYARKQPDTVATALLPQIDPTTPVSNVDPKTMNEVVAIVGRQPERKIEGSNYWQITYCWRAGLPWKTHDLHVVFTKGNPPIYYSHSVGSEMIDYPAETVSDSMSEEDRQAIYDAVRRMTGEVAPGSQGHGPPPTSEDEAAEESAAPGTFSQ